MAMRALRTGKREKGLLAMTAETVASSSFWSVLSMKTWGRRGKAESSGQTRLRPVRTYCSLQR